MLYLHVITHVLGACGGQERALDYLELELLTVVSQYVVVGTDLWSHYSSPLFGLSRHLAYQEE